MIDTTNYDPKTLDKVNRLIDVLSEINRHPLLSKSVCLHGGTAINLFMQMAPRLSIDADITYIGSTDKTEMELERPDIEKSIEDVGMFLGYNVTATQSAIAGRTFRLRYNGSWGNDYIKIDINYLNRVPLYTPVMSTCTMNENVVIKTLSYEELIAGKAKALFDRVAVRDLYDIASIYSNIDKIFDLDDMELKMRLHRSLLFYTSLSNLFPTEFDGLTQKRFANREKRINEELYPVLHVNDRPTLSDMIEMVENFVSEYVIPQDDTEKEYLHEFSLGKYRPELLFEQWPILLENAQASPAVQWKLLNLQKRK